MKSRKTPTFGEAFRVSLMLAYVRASCVNEDILLFEHLAEAIRAKDAAQFRYFVNQLDPFEFLTDRHRFLSRRQGLALITKAPLKLSSEADRKAKALESFLDSERRCRRANKRFRFLAEPGRLALLYRRRPILARCLQQATVEFSRLLGPCDLETVVEFARPGPGVTQGIQHKNYTDCFAKMFLTDQTATEGLIPLVDSLVGGTSWAECLEGAGMPVKVVDASVGSMVPKDWKTQRMIAIEPSLNTWFQLGVHEVLARRLAAVGNSITDQKRNGLAARSDSVATLDLSQASDSVSTGLIEFLSRIKTGRDSNASRWLELLRRLRTTSVVVEGSPYRLEKFSSMGNGFTFAVETILFLSLARAAATVAGDSVVPTCYGDDFVVGHQSCLLLTELLEYCGFVVNRDKSFYYGDFRESCGYDWLGGEYCTPLYVREDRLEEGNLYQLYNDSFYAHGAWEGVRGLIVRSLERGGIRPIWATGEFPPDAGLYTEELPVSASWAPAIQNYVQTLRLFKPDSYELVSEEKWYAVALLSRYNKTEGDARRTSVRRSGRYRYKRVPIVGRPWGPLERKLREVEPA